MTLSALQSGVRAGEGRLGVSPVAGSGVASKAISVGQFEAVQAKDAMGDIPSDNPPTKGPSGNGRSVLECCLASPFWRTRRHHRCNRPVSKWTA